MCKMLSSPVQGSVVTVDEAVNVQISQSASHQGNPIPSSEQLTAGGICSGDIRMGPAIEC
jgi:hypothetical protein